MEATEELTLGTTKDLANIVKGKRTKRQRPQSPIPFTITTHLSSGEGGGAGYGGNGDHNNNNNNSSSSQPASSDEFAISTTTEDEDTARLLILLARGQSRDYSSNYKNDINNNNNYDQDYSTSSFKFNSKRYIETSSTVNGKAGMYVYECKTCNRTFPSFQALGGHRASHKKPKNMAMAAAAAAAAEEKKQQLSFAFSDEDEASFKTTTNIAPLSYQLNNHNNTSNMTINNHKSSITTAKIHECSYCGAEFTSGQALGGHMRRHRGANNAAIATAAAGVTNTALSLSPLSPLSVNQDSEEAAKKLRNGAGLSLSLDLNLPAPEDDHNKYSFAVKQQQNQHQQDQTQQQQQQQQKKEPTLLLSTTPTLVDCHY